MDWQALLNSIPTLAAGFVSGFGVAITKGVSKVIEDTWTDRRAEKKRVKERKNQIVSQLLFDIPRGKAQNFEVTVVKKSEGEQTIAQIACYDRKIAKKVEAYLNLWRRFASANIQFNKLGEVMVMAEDDQPESRGPDYLEALLNQLYGDYDEIIDLLNTWHR